MSSPISLSDLVTYDVFNGSPYAKGLFVALSFRTKKDAEKTFNAIKRDLKNPSLKTSIFHPRALDFSVLGHHKIVSRSLLAVVNGVQSHGARVALDGQGYVIYKLRDLHTETLGRGWGEYPLTISDVYGEIKNALLLCDVQKNPDCIIDTCQPSKKGFKEMLVLGSRFNALIAQFPSADDILTRTNLSAPAKKAGAEILSHRFGPAYYPAAKYPYFRRNELSRM